MGITIKPKFGKGQYIGEEIKLEKEKTYHDAVTHRVIPKDISKHHFKIVSTAGLLGSKFKAVRIDDGKTYTVILDSDYVVYKLS